MKKYNQSGFTTLEMLLSVGIVGLIVALGAPAGIEAYNNSIETQSEVALTNQITAYIEQKLDSGETVDFEQLESLKSSLKDQVCGEVK